MVPNFNPWATGLAVALDAGAFVGIFALALILCGGLLVILLAVVAAVTGDVVNRRRGDDPEEWCQGPVECRVCTHRWTGVAPARRGLRDLECPWCGQEAGDPAEAPEWMA